MKISIPPEIWSSCSSDSSVGVVLSRLDMVIVLDVFVLMASGISYFWEMQAYAKSRSEIEKGWILGNSKKLWLCKKAHICGLGSCIPRIIAYK